jgi:O-antigen ligase/polysaccharide polymerase Wzy-like membrane protein
MRPLPERLSKVATLAATVLIIPLHLTVDPSVGWTLRIIAAAAFVIAVVCGRRWPRLTPAVVMGAAPIVPVLLASILHVAAMNVFYTVILTALFGALLPAVPRDRWELPPAWRLPLGVWALTLSLAWPVMILREAGLRLATLLDTGALDSWANLNTPQVESWILHVVLAQLVGLVWLESLFIESAAGAGAGLRPSRNASASLAGAFGGGGKTRPYTAEDPPFAVHGLWIGASIASLVAVYQGTVNMAFLSGGIWPGLLRAAGTLLDANAYGAVAALAGPIAFVSIPYLGIARPRIAQAAALALNWAGAWMSGSRTGLVCGAVGTLLLVYELVRSGNRDRLAERRTPEMLGGAIVIVLVLIVGAGAVGPLKRMTDAGTRPGASLADLWTRGGYGSVATRMVRDYPLTGVGIGSFNWMAPDYWRQMANDKLPFDNAQNWWRHQVAELGLVASLPILVWSFLIAWLVVTRRSRPNARIETETLRGLLIGLGAASLLGMPTQNPIVLLIFFYCVARFEMLTRVPPESRLPAEAPRAKAGTPNPESRIPALAWIAGVIIAVGYAGGHLLLARGPLEPVTRAALTNRDYVIGTYPAERIPQGQFRWTKKHATFTLAAPSRYLVIRYHVGHPDIEMAPVKLQIRTPCQVLVDELRTSMDVRARAFELPEGQRRVTFDTDVWRTWQPSTFGQADTRELGVAIEADFVGTPSVVAAQDRWIPLQPCGS